MPRAVPALAADWGPDRPLVPYGQGDVPAFNNSIFNEGVDFRTQLVSARDAAYTDSPPPNGGYALQIPVQEGSSYRVRFLPFNSAEERPGMTITGARAFVTLPMCSSTDVRLVGAVSGANAVPHSVWSTVHFFAQRPFKLILDNTRQASICFSSDVCSGGKFSPFGEMPQMVGKDGALLGAYDLDGTFPGASGPFVMFYVRPVFD